MSKLVRSLLVVFAVALAVRVAAAVFLGIDGPARGDERGYALLAQSLAAGEGLRLQLPKEWLISYPVFGLPEPRAFRAPLLPAVLAPVAALGGGLAAMRCVSLALGAACAPLLLLAARRLLSERAAFVAALAYALWPPLVHLSLYALSEPLSMVLLLPAIGLTANKERGPCGAAIAGVLAGLAILARPAVLLSALLLAPAAGSRRRALVLGACLVATLAPWLLRNAVVVGSPVLTTNSGVTLVGANNEGAARAEVPGKWWPPEEVYPTDGNGPDLGMWGWCELTEVESNRRFASDAMTWVRSHPTDALALTGWKLVRLFDPDPRSAKPDAWWKALVGWLTLTPVLVLALLGLRDLARRPRAWQPWAAPLVGTLITALIFYGDTRMRTAADPTLLLLAAAGGMRVFGACTRRNSTEAPRSG